MTLDVRPLSQLTQEALSVLYARLGLVDTIRFLNQFTTGFGNYTEERRAFVDQQTLEDSLAEVRAFQAGRKAGD